jgi:leader peptidase (prepilin peptidase)/N-methyltransferase
MLELLTANTWLLYAVTFIFGTLIGSFLNVVILRLPPRIMHEWRCQCRELLETGETADDPQPPGLVLARSKCPGCGNQLSALENVPLLSYIVLRGRCSNCKQKISLRYPAVETLTGLAFVIVVWKFGLSEQALYALAFTGFLVAMSGIDIDHQLLPDNLTLPLMWAGLLLALNGSFTDPVSSLIGAAAGYLSLWFIYHLFRIATGKEGMGYGDFKLLAAIGAWLGWQVLPQVILLSSLVGAVTGIAMLAVNRNRKGQPIPFGPFLAVAGWIAMIWGDRISAAYSQYFGI